jgi:hypothetical protein
MGAPRTFPNASTRSKGLLLDFLCRSRCADQNAHMNSYIAFKLVHILIAVLGIGQVGALLILSWQKPSAPALTLSIARIVTVSLLMMVLSGIGLLKLAGWAFAPTVWVRASFFFVLVIGFLASRISRSVRSGNQPDGSPANLRLHSTSIVLLTGTVVWLMTAKPF